MPAASAKHILIVDDEQAISWALERGLTREGYRVAVASSAEEAFQKAEKQRPNAIILDVRLPGLDGLSALARLRQMAHDAPVIVITAYGNLSTAVRAVEGGAFDYLTKPFDLAQAIDAVARALQRSAPTSEETRREIASRTDEIVGASPAMQVVFKRIALVAPRSACVLITGESGTGKELVARAIHRHSARSDKPFLPVHIAALNPSLVESELFGHVKGAFTGATQSRQGLLALADGGTVFLDELADIPLAVQAKLLRVLEHNEVLPVGGNLSQRLDIRLLAATHQDLSRKVADGSFRQDLFYRLNVFQIHLPALRERLEDIMPLAEHFLRQIEPSLLPLSPDFVRVLQQRSWRGNVRELRNALEHAAIVAHGSALLADHLPPPLGDLVQATDAGVLGAAVRQWLRDELQRSGAEPPVNLHARIVAHIEAALLNELMKRVQGNRWEAARWLGLNRATVRKKLAEYGLSAAPRGDDDEKDD